MDQNRTPMANPDSKTNSIGRKLAAAKSAKPAVAPQKNANRSKYENSKAFNAAFREYKYQHSLFWKLVFRSTSAISALLILPFYRDLGKAEIASYAVVFPCIAICLSIVVCWLLQAERDRMAPSRNAVIALRPLVPNEANKSGYEQKLLMLKPSIANTIAWSIGIFGTLLGVLAVLILLKSTAGCIAGSLIFLFLLWALVGILIKYSRSSKIEVSNGKT